MCVCVCVCVFASDTATEADDDDDVPDLETVVTSSIASVGLTSRISAPSSDGSSGAGAASKTRSLVEELD